jgi:hypothetical protein
MQRKTQEEVWKEYVLRTLRQFRKILTTQGSHIGEVISTDGTNLIWTTVSGGSSLPDQTGNNGKYLTTNGSTASWATVTIPSGIVTTSDVGTVTNTMLAGSIQGSKLLANTITSDRLRQSVSTSVIGTPGSTTANVQDIQATADNQVLRRSSGVLSFGQVATGGIENYAITNSKFRQSSGYSVIGRPQNNSGEVIDIQASTAGHVLRRTADSLTFGTIDSSSIVASSISNDRLANSSITINGTSVALGGSITVSGSRTQTINSSTSLTVNFNSGNFVQINLISNITSLTLSNAVAGIYIFKLTQDSTGNRTVTWPTSIKWPGNVPPVLSTAAGKIDIITLVFDGSNYYGTYALNY